MAIPTRIIKRRIKSIRSTGKIMKAMELVAASKMRKATQLTLGTRPYASLIQQMTQELQSQIDPKRYPLLVGRPSKDGSILLVIVASDRGLCGGFNSQLLKKTMEFVRTRDKTKIRAITIGRRAEQAVRRAGIELLASFEAISNAPNFEKAKPMIEMIVKEFIEGRAERIFLAYTDFKSALTQLPTVAQLLPIIPESQLPRLEAEEEEGEETRDKSEEENGILFEPSSQQIFQELLPRVVEMQSYQSFLESAASEHAARMMAMRSAGDAAGEMLDTLTFTLNQARQAAITQEISEISAGKAALQ